jgi:hypothetical protein
LFACCPCFMINREQLHYLQLPGNSISPSALTWYEICFIIIHGSSKYNQRLRHNVAETHREMVESTSDEEMCMSTRVVVNLYKRDITTLCLSSFEPEYLKYKREST